MHFNKNVARVAPVVFLAVVAFGALGAFFAVPAFGEEEVIRHATSRGEAMRTRQEAFLAFGFLKPEVVRLLRATEGQGSKSAVGARTFFEGVYHDSKTIRRKVFVSPYKAPYFPAEKWRIPWNNGEVLEIYRMERGYFTWGFKWGDPGAKAIVRSSFGTERADSTVIARRSE